MSENIWMMVAESGPVGQLVLLVLFFFSVVSWAIAGQKFAHLKSVRRQTADFLELFHSDAEVGQIYRRCKDMKRSPLCGLFRAGYEFSASLQPSVAGSGRAEELGKVLDRMAAEQVGKLERNLPFLATVASASPFIGLLGTVWGIMVAFHSIGLSGSANLAVVAPGIAEALVATAAGLGAAIPALIAYNYFLSRIDAMQREAELFAAELAVLLGSGAHP